jgi:hypothetical protein
MVNSSNLFNIENSGSSFTATSTRLNYSSASKSKIDNILRDLANDSSSDDDVGINSNNYCFIF